MNVRTLTIFGSLAVLVPGPGVTEGAIAQKAYVKASNTGVADFFGVAVAVSGNTVVVGAAGEASNATGVNGNQADDTAFGAGAVYVFVHDANGVWTQQAYLKASNSQPNDSFGVSVAISGDTLVVGATGEASGATGVGGDQTDNSAGGSGAAYVFVRNGTTWSQQAYLKASNTGIGDRFGKSVAISGDSVVIGANGESSNATGVNGNGADNSASFSGAAYVFVRSAGAWTQQAYLKASNTGTNDDFGLSVAISGDTVAIGADSEASSATGVNGNQADNTAPGAGAAYVLVRDAIGVWTQQAYVKASNTELNDIFGSSVAISNDSIVVGAPGEGSNATGVNGDQTNNGANLAGAAYVFIRSGATWTQQAYLKASNTNAIDQFGAAVSLSGDTIVVGAYGEDSNATGVNGNEADNTVSGSGAAYMFTRSGSAWSQLAYLKASNTGLNDHFGSFVGLAGDTLVVAAYTESSNATGVNGNQVDDSFPSAGAAYIFMIDTDGDGTPDSLDLCLDDPAKSSPGQCGCGAIDTDSDGDGTADCVDGCPSDPLKNAAGDCGCGVADIDADGNGVADCIDSVQSAQAPSCGVCGPTASAVNLTLLGLTAIGPRIRRRRHRENRF